MSKYEHLFKDDIEQASGHVYHSQQATEVLADALERRGRKGTANKIRQGRNHGFWEYLEAVEIALRLNDPAYPAGDENEPY